MTAAKLMTHLTRLGIRIEAHGDRLRYSPRSAVTPDLANRMKAHKADLLQLLTTTIRCPWCRSVDLIDGWRGVRCQSCERLAWLPTEGGGAVRADCAGERYVDAGTAFDQDAGGTPPTQSEVEAATRPHQQTLLD